MKDIILISLCVALVVLVVLVFLFYIQRLVDINKIRNLEFELSQAKTAYKVEALYQNERRERAYQDKCYQNNEEK